MSDGQDFPTGIEGIADDAGDFNASEVLAEGDACGDPGGASWEELVDQGIHEKMREVINDIFRLSQEASPQSVARAMEYVPMAGGGQQRCLVDPAQMERVARFLTDMCDHFYARYYQHMIFALSFASDHRLSDALPSRFMAGLPGQGDLYSPDATTALDIAIANLMQLRSQRGGGEDGCEMPVVKPARRARSAAPKKAVARHGAD